MRKYFVLTLAILLSGCVSPYRFNYDELKEKIVLAKVVEVKYLPERYLLVMTVINDSLLNDFLTDLSNIEFNQLIGDPESIRGVCAQIFYENDDYHIICNRKIEKFSAQGIQIESKSKYADSLKFDAFIRKYLE